MVSHFGQYRSVGACEKKSSAAIRIRTKGRRGEWSARNALFIVHRFGQGHSLWNPRESNGFLIANQRGALLNVPITPVNARNVNIHALIPLTTQKPQIIIGGSAMATGLIALRSYYSSLSLFYLSRNIDATSTECGAFYSSLDSFTVDWHLISHIWKNCQEVLNTAWQKVRHQQQYWHLRFFHLFPLTTTTVWTPVDTNFRSHRATPTGGATSHQVVQTVFWLLWRRN